MTQTPLTLRYNNPGAVGGGQKRDYQWNEALPIEGGEGGGEQMAQPMGAGAGGMPQQQKQPSFLESLQGRISNPMTQSGIGLFLSAMQGGDLNSGFSAGMNRANSWQQQQMRQEAILQQAAQRAQLQALMGNQQFMAGIPPAIAQIARVTGNAGPIQSFLLAQSKARAAQQSQGDPADIRTWKAWLKMSPPERREFLALKRAGNYVDTGFGYVRVDPLSQAYGNDGMIPKMSPGQKSLDQTFATDYSEFQQGGLADAQKGLQQIATVRKELDDIASGKTKGNLTGPVIGSLHDAIGAMVNPSAVDRRELVEEVIQRNLRIILGGQFAQKEGEQLIARAYNPRLPEKANAERLRRLEVAMSRGLEAKLKMSSYFENNRTLAGYKGPRVPTMAEINAAIEDKSLGAQEQPTATGGFSIRKLD
jgi:hypothetical protein